MKNLTRWILLISLFTLPALRADEYEEEMDEDEMEWMEEVEKSVMLYLGNVEPRALERMEELAEEEEEAYWEILIEVAEALEEIEELSEEAPEFAALYERILQSEIKMETLGDAIQNADSDEEKEELIAELKALLPVAFDDRLKEAEMELEFLQMEMAEIKAEWERRKANRDKIIEKRFSELVAGDDDDLEW